MVLCTVLLMGAAACDGGEEETPTETPQAPGEEVPPEDDPTATVIDLSNYAYAGASFSVESKYVAEYLNAATPTEALAVLEKYANAGYRAAANSIRLRWKGNGSDSYVVSLADNAEFVNAREYETTTVMINVTNLIPETTYYWKVSGEKENDTSATDTFKTTGTVRYIAADGGANMRDLGGWKTADGKSVKYGLLYRGNMLNGRNGGPKLTEKGIATFKNELKMKTELDLRSQNKDDANQSANWWDSSLPYVKVGLSQYTGVIPFDSGTGYWIDASKNIYGDPEAAAELKIIFETLENADNYPIYMHCNAGADRTGTLAYLVNGFLGVPYEDLVKDFELTSFSISGKRYRSKALNGEFDDSGVFQNDSNNYVAFELMHEMILQHYGTQGGTLQQAIENYLTSFVGVSKTSLDKIKAIMLTA
ncbi:MAG: tyrosine-protein phosphatase [Clostridia bacterium]|nr:tyrosine-protein phosphatase [Clostridia bacterium]